MDTQRTIEIPVEQLQAMLDFIDRALDREWDHYTDNVIVRGVSWEEGKRRMDPEVYDIVQTLTVKINE